MIVFPKLNCKSKYNYTCKELLKSNSNTMFTIYEYYILKNKIKNKSCSTHRILSHKLSIGYHFNQVDDDNHRIQNVSQKHVLMQSYPLAAKASGKKK